MNFYILLTEEFCNLNANYSHDNLKFGYGVTKDGKYVTSVNSLNELPELFTGMDIQVIQLDRSAF